MIRQRTVTETEVQEPVLLAARLNQMLDAGIAHSHSDTLDVSRIIRAQDRVIYAGPLTIPVGVTFTVLGRMVVL